MMASGVVAVDASLALKWVLDEPYAAEADALAAQWVAAGMRPLAPVLLAYESTNALYRKQPAPDSQHLAWVALSVADLLAVLTLVSPDLALLERATVLSAQLGRPAAYDTQYAALAEREGCELWTADERFWNAATPHFRWVRWVGEVSASRGPAR